MNSVQAERPLWRPVLDGKLGAMADDAVSDIASALVRSPPIADPSLAAGLAGLALFFAYLGRARPDQGHEEQARCLLDLAVEAVANEPLGVSLYGGFTGVAWTAQHLAETAAEDSRDATEDDPNEEIDKALQAYLQTSPWPDDFDLIRGLTGIAVYALERTGQRSGRKCLELVLDRLEELAEREDGHATWYTTPGMLVRRDGGEHIEGHYDVGVAHGVPGVLVVLAAMARADIGRGRARTLFNDATAWLLDRKLPDWSGECRFPYWVGPRIRPISARLGWCYGDAGVAGALLAAERVAMDSALQEEALALARRAAKLPTARTDVIDASLCHGAAGLGHIFNRIYQSSGDESCADAARSWFARTLEMRKPGEGAGGFRAWAPWANPDGGWQSTHGFLTGAAGIALALLGATSTVDPAWDRVLLLSCAAIDARAPSPSG